MRPFRGNVFNKAKTDTAVTAMLAVATEVNGSASRSRSPAGSRLSILLGRVA